MLEKRKIFRRKEVQKILKTLKGRKIEPVFTFKEGVSYPELEKSTGLSREKVTSTLRKLHKREILTASQVSKNMVACPECGSHQHIVHLSCPSCKSSHLEKGETIKHLHCGHSDLESQFRRKDGLVCPKCEKNLKAIGVDYRRQGMIYKCLNCEMLSPNPEVRYTCSNEHTFQKKDLKLEGIYTYRINPSQREVVDRHLIEFKTLLEEVTEIGWQGEISPNLRGESGAKHRFAFSLWPKERKDENQPEVVADLSTSQEGAVDANSVLAFQAKNLDVGNSDKVLMVMPRLDKAAKKLARSYNIHVVEAEETKELMEETKKLLLDIIQEERD